MKKLLSVFPLILALGCVSMGTSQPQPDIFFPKSFWDRETRGLEHQADRYAENWEAALQYPQVRKHLQARLYLGQGSAYRMISGEELVALSHQQTVLVRHTRGGDFNEELGVWNPGCPGSFFQNRLSVYHHIQRLRPDVAIAEIHTQENDGCTPPSRLLQEWARRTERRLADDPESLQDFYRMWGVYKWDRENPELDRWLLVAETARERRKAIKETACEGWTWQISPSTPFVFRYENGQVVEYDGHHLVVFGTQLSLFEGSPEVQGVWKSYVQGWMDSEDRKQYSLNPLSSAQEEAGRYVARSILAHLALL